MIWIFLSLLCTINSVSWTGVIVLSYGSCPEGFTKLNETVTKVGGNIFPMDIEEIGDIRVVKQGIQNLRHDNTNHGSTTVEGGSNNPNHNNNPNNTTPTTPIKSPLVLCQLNSEMQLSLRLIAGEPTQFQLSNRAISITGLVLGCLVFALEAIALCCKFCK